MCNIIYQQTNDREWKVESISGSNPGGYMVKRLLDACTECSLKEDFRVCKESDCVFLCPHMYSCDSKCYDYANNHMCKHIHRVHSLFNRNLPTKVSVPWWVLLLPDHPDS